MRLFSASPELRSRWEPFISLQTLEGRCLPRNSDILHNALGVRDKCGLTGKRYTLCRSSLPDLPPSPTARQKAQKAAAGDTPDSYDLDDPFINDSDSDDYAPDDSGSDWSAEEGSGSDEDDRRRRDREARRLTGRR